MDCSTKAPSRMLVRLFFTSLAFCFWPQAAWAEYMCEHPRSGDVIVAEVIGPGAGYYLCDSAPEGSGAASMRYFSPEEWKAFFDHMAEVDARNERERIQMGQRYRQLQEGLWFMPGEEPFAGWSPGSASSPGRKAGDMGADSGCTASYWTPAGAVIMSTLGGRNGIAVISYMGYSIPAPDKSKSRKFSLTQSGETQTVTAMISKAGHGRKKMGMVSFAVRTGDILVGAIDDVQDYSLSDNGKTIFSGQWHDGLRARDALAQCLAQRQ